MISIKIDAKYPFLSRNSRKFAEKSKVAVIRGKVQIRGNSRKSLNSRKNSQPRIPRVTVLMHTDTHPVTLCNFLCNLSILKEKTDLFFQKFYFFKYMNQLTAVLIVLLFLWRLNHWCVCPSLSFFISWFWIKKKKIDSLRMTK